MSLLKPKFLMRINYVSGIQEEVWCDEFTVKGSGEMEWILSDPKSKKPLQMAENLKQIESVWQIKIGYTFMGFRVW